MNHVDVVFLGSSPNALAAAARLAGSGRSVLVLESRAAVGGPVATEEFAPGFRADTGVMSAALDPEIAGALGVGLDVIARDSVTVLGPGMVPVTVHQATPALARVLPELPESVGHAVDLLRAIHRTEPPDLPAASGADGASLAELGGRLLGYGKREAHEVMRLLFMSARDFFGETVAHPATRAALASVAVRGLAEGPFGQGTVFGFLHHTAVGDGLFRSSVRGGVQGLAQALADKARSLGADVRTSVAAPFKVDVDAGVARGVILGSGEKIAAGAVVSDFDVRATFTRLVAPPELDPEVNRAIRHVRCRGMVARVHVGLSSMPVFEGVAPEALRGTLVLSPDVSAIERAWDRAKRGAVSTHPHLEVTVPTASDPSLAPAGSHTLDVWVHYVPRGHTDREHLWHSVLEQLGAFSPGIAGKVLHHHVSLPEDLEARFGLTEGHLYGGEIRLSQSFFSRPLPGFAHYGSPIENLYLGGSAAHPGGYSGRAGWNLAGALLRGQS